MNGKRNAGLELMRLLMMFGIVAMHAAVQCAYPQDGSHWTILDWCVCGFVFISGYFGVKFNVRKCLNMVALCIWCAIVSNIAGGAGALYAIKGICGYWFLWAYLLLMMLAPLIDAAFAGKVGRTIFILSAPVLFAVYAWGVMCAIPYVRDWIPSPRGLDGCTFLSLVGIYIAVRLYKSLDLGRFCTMRNAIWMLPICVIAMLAGFWWYWWIPAFVVSCFAFEFFRRLKMPSTMERIVLFLAPSAFAVYLLHITSGGLSLMSRLELCLVEKQGWGILAAFCATSVITYLICLVLDIGRRNSCGLFKMGLKHVVS